MKKTVYVPWKVFFQGAGSIIDLSPTIQLPKPMGKDLNKAIGRTSVPKSRKKDH